MSDSRPTTSTAADRLLSPDAHEEELELLPLAAGTVVDGSPSAGHHTLVEDLGLTVGVWELTPGTVTDIEVDEVFVVLSGTGSVTFHDGSAVNLTPGAVVRLRAGDTTTWVVTDTIRKVYVA